MYLSEHIVYQDIVLRKSLVAGCLERKWRTQFNKIDIDYVDIRPLCEKVLLLAKTSLDSRKRYTIDTILSKYDKEVTFRIMTKLCLGTLRIFQEQVNHLYKSTISLLCLNPITETKGVKRKADSKAKEIKPKKRRIIDASAFDPNAFQYSTYNTYRNLLEEAENLIDNHIDVEEYLTQTNDLYVVKNDSLIQLLEVENSPEPVFGLAELDDDMGFGNATAEEIEEYDSMQESLSISQQSVKRKPLAFPTPDADIPRYPTKKSRMLMRLLTANPDELMENIKSLYLNATLTKQSNDLSNNTSINISSVPSVECDVGIEEIPTPSFGSLNTPTKETSEICLERSGIHDATFDENFYNDFSTDIIMNETPKLKPLPKKMAFGERMNQYRPQQNSRILSNIQSDNILRNMEGIIPKKFSVGNYVSDANIYSSPHMMRHNRTMLNEEVELPCCSKSKSNIKLNNQYENISFNNLADTSQTSFGENIDIAAEAILNDNVANVAAPSAVLKCINMNSDKCFENVGVNCVPEHGNISNLFLAPRQSTYKPPTANFEKNEFMNYLQLGSKNMLPNELSMLSNEPPAQNMGFINSFQDILDRSNESQTQNASTMHNFQDILDPSLQHTTSDIHSLDKSVVQKRKRAKPRRKAQKQTVVGNVIDKVAKKARASSKRKRKCDVTTTTTTTTTDINLNENDATIKENHADEDYSVMEMGQTSQSLSVWNSYGVALRLLTIWNHPGEAEYIVNAINFCLSADNRIDRALAFASLLVLSGRGYISLQTHPNTNQVSYIRQGPRFYDNVAKIIAYQKERTRLRLLRD